MTSRGGISKLDVYAGIRVPEVWFFEEGRLSIYGLGRKGYVRRERSAFLPGLDVELLARLGGSRKQAQAVGAFRDALRRRG